MERLSILQSLSPVGNYEQLVRVKGLVDKIKITDKEEADNKLEVSANGVTVPKEARKVKTSFNFNPGELALLKNVFSDLNDKGALDMSTADLYKIFVLSDDKDTKTEIKG